MQPQPSARSADPSGSLIVALSDIHIGDGGPTCWYQPDVHEPALLTIIDWVTDRADDVRELVLLGDVVDLWTYPFGQRPPTFLEIAAANPTIFGPDGAIARALDALDGNVVWVGGNHDMGIDPADAATVVSPGGHRLRLLSDLEYQPLAPDPRVLMSHGHTNTLFNAVDPLSPWDELPSGHFVTRAVAEHWHRNLEPGQSVADLPGQGAPNGLDLSGLATAFARVGADGSGVVGLLFDYLLGSLDVGEEDEILMPDGSIATLADGRAAYGDVWSRWAEAHGGGSRGEIEALRATWGDAMEELAWFAQSDAFRTNADIVVMGHTHGAVSDLDNSSVRYLNAGFECPSAADAAEKPITFAVVDVSGEEVSGSVWAVVDHDGRLECEPTTAPTEAIVTAGAMDFSCYLELDNRAGTSDLRLESAEVSRGQFVHPPPTSIAAGARARIWVKDDLGPFGSAAIITYSRTSLTGAEEVVRFDIACPTGVARNRCDASVDFVARSGEEDWGRTHEVRWLGHPLFVRAELG